ncbi:hypothetical protein SG64_18605 [Enterobacter hormaechei subsp. xiangfangensis]|nr:hypothetical protein SG64_18605 [Enterobacter hormaechei subsp. xiangfangensis]
MECAAVAFRSSICLSLASSSSSRARMSSSPCFSAASRNASLSMLLIGRPPRHVYSMQQSPC